VKDELRLAAETKANEGKKAPAKGAPVESLPVDPDVAFTAMFCQAIAPETINKCLASQATLHSVCRRRGYVMDAWDGTKVIHGLSSMRSSVQFQSPISLQKELSSSHSVVDLVLELQVARDHFILISFYTLNLFFKALITFLTTVSVLQCCQ
jgi:hypothetical protein